MTLRGRDLIADWIETALLVRGARPIGLDALHGFFERHQGLEPQRVNIGIREMDRRSRLLGPRYPFKIHGEFAVQATVAAPSSTYSTIALMAPGGPVREFVSASPDETMAVIFENATADALTRLWGDEGKALRFGWPSDIGRPPEFDLAIRWLADKIGVEVGRGYRQPRRKDGGVDVVAWRPFGDGRSGFPVLLCAVHPSGEPARQRNGRLQLAVELLARDGRRSGNRPRDTSRASTRNDLERLAPSTW